MPVSSLRYLPFALLAALILLLVWNYSSPNTSWREVHKGAASSFEGPIKSSSTAILEAKPISTPIATNTELESLSILSPLGLLPVKPPSGLDTTRPPGSTYSQVLVVTRQKKEDVSWISRELPHLKTAIYTVDDENAALRPPTNKGHESMVYLTYIVDNYETLADTTIFVHAHQVAYHNNDLLGSDMVRMLKRLNNQHVAEVGYFNLRCHLDPGCPDWLHMNASQENINRKEEIIFPKIWDSLHPGKPLPDVLSHPCCSQIAASRARLQSIPLSEWKRYQHWLSETDLSDEVSGRIWEYTWQYILTGLAELCPPMHECYCQGYRVCFLSTQHMEAWFDLREGMRALEKEVGTFDERKQDATELKRRIGNIKKMLDEQQADAIRRGDELIASEKSST